MEELEELHNNIIYYLAIILFATTWIIISIILSYIQKNSISKYTNDYRLYKVIFAVTPTLILILIALPSFKLLYLMDEVIDPSLVINGEGHQWFLSSSDIPGGGDGDTSPVPSISDVPELIRDGPSTGRSNIIPIVPEIEAYCKDMTIPGNDTKPFLDTISETAEESIYEWIEQLPWKCLEPHPEGVEAVCPEGQMPVTEELDHFVDHVIRSCSCFEREDDVFKEALDSYKPFFNTEANETPAQSVEGNPSNSGGS